MKKAGWKQPFCLFYGGKKDSYKETVQAWINGQQHVEHATEFHNKIIDLGDDRIQLKILESIESHETNEESIILHILLTDTKNSAIFTGDACGRNTKAILQREKSIEGVKIMLASHHGASTHDSNSEDWIKATNPKIVIFSVGKMKTTYYHPRLEVGVQYIECSKNLSSAENQHNLSFAYCTETLVSKCKDLALVSHTGAFELEEWYEFSTKRGVYSTHNSGTLIFNLDKL